MFNRGQPGYAAHPLMTWRSRTARFAWLVRRLGADVGTDAAFVVRQIRRSPGFTFLVVATLAIGIGANATMAGAVDRLLLRPPPGVRAPQDVARLLVEGHSATGSARVTPGLNYPAYLDIQRSAPGFGGVAGYGTFILPFGVGIESSPVHTWVVSSNFFRVLGIDAAVGRLFDDAAQSPTSSAIGGDPVAILGYDFWRRQFGGLRTALGRNVRVGPLSYTVIGVAPPGFKGAETDAPDVYLPVTVAATELMPPGLLTSRGVPWFNVIGRLRPGVTPAIAEQEASAAWLHGNGYFAGDSSSHLVAASIIPGRGPDAPRVVHVALWLAAVSSIVLLIACANVANLLLGRAFVRRRETAVRLALGASRGRLARQLLVEGMALAGLGAVGAVWLAALGGGLLRHAFAEIGIGTFVDLHVLGFTAVITLLTGVMMGLAPMLQAAVPNLTSGLRAGGPGAIGRAGRARSVLVTIQAAFCLVLLVGAGVFVLSMRHVNDLDLGMDVAHTLTVRFDLNTLGLPRPAAQAALDRIAASVRAVPGVTRIAFAAGDPYQGGYAVSPETPERGETPTMRRAWDGQVAYEIAVDSGFFRTVGAASLRGRDFGSADRRGAPRVAIIDAPVANLLWPGEDAIGRCMLLAHWQDPASRECVTVVGVLHGFWQRDILNRGAFLVYVPLAQSRVTAGRWPSGMFVRSENTTASARAAIRRAVQGAQPQLRAVTVNTMADVLEPQFHTWRAAGAMFALFGGVALAISVIGLYGVVAFNAAQRSMELAVRLALGARPRHVLMAVGADGLRAVSGGLAAGSIVVVVVHPVIDPLLFRVSAGDPAIILMGGAILILVWFLATLIPTVRVLRRSPAAVLRAE